MGMRLRLGIIAIACLWLAACTTLGAGGLVTSATHTEISASAASAIAGDMVSRFAEHVGPGKGTIVLNRDGSVFGDALEAALRGWGYAVATEQKTEGETIRLAYVVDSFENSVLARLSTDQVEVGRAYIVTAAGATPSSPVSIMQRG